MIERRGVQHLESRGRTEINQSQMHSWDHRGGQSHYFVGTLNPCLCLRPGFLCPAWEPVGMGVGRDGSLGDATLT